MKHRPVHVTLAAHFAISSLRGTPIMWCNIGNERLWYQAHGKGVPIIFLHGWTMDHRDEAPVYEPIFAKRRGYRRIYPDLPAMGKSPAHSRIKNQDDYLQVALQFIEAMTKGERFLLAGTSAGAYLARGVVQRLADRMDGLLLRVPLMVAADKNRDVPKFVALLKDESFMARLSDADRETYAQLLVHTPHYLKAAKRKQEKQVGPATKAADAAHLEPIRRDPSRYGFSFDADKLAKPFAAPALIVTGRQDVTVGYRDAWRVVENYPRATFAVLDRADHGLPIDHDVLFRALVNDWLNRVEEARGASRRA
jgi:pimeloyl-ACP methyl ester carboxylesterase